jgi:hypothetical protein
LREVDNSASQECRHGLAQITDFRGELDQSIHAGNFGYVCKYICRVILRGDRRERFAKRARVAGDRKLVMFERAEDDFRYDDRT